MTTPPPLIAIAEGRRPSARKMPTLERARELFNYDPKTGLLTRTITLGAKHHGYLMVCIDGKQYPAHRVAWLLMTGEWPREQMQIDHANMNTTDNRWENLREATMAQNQANTRVSRSNKTGLKGVSTHFIKGKDSGKWRSGICIGGKGFHLGIFDCPAAAQFAYVIAADKAFGPFARAS